MDKENVKIDQIRNNKGISEFSIVQNNHTRTGIGSINTDGMACGLFNGSNKTIDSYLI